MIQEGKTFGIFQLETPEFTKFIQKLKPTKFDHLISALALFRPATLSSGIADQYIQRKEEGWEWTPQYPEWQKLFPDTYGLPIYQEQIMKLAQYEVGWDMATADTLRKAIAKKKENLLAELYQDWQARGGSDEIWQIIEAFGGYGFNKAHATAYAMITYQTAYLKYYYHTIYITAVLNSYMENREKLIYAIAEARKEGITIHKPSPASADDKFKMLEKGHILAPLKLIKGLTTAQIEKLRKGQMTSSVEEKLSKAGVLNKFRTMLFNTMEEDINEVEAFGFYFDHPFNQYHHLHDYYFAIPTTQYDGDGYLIGNILTTKDYKTFSKLTIQDNYGTALIYARTEDWGWLKEYKGKNKFFVFKVIDSWLQDAKPLDSLPVFLYNNDGGEEI
jgi:DNA polymerase III alpha subunit